jgi:class 3 adenylate cyclase
MIGSTKVAAQLTGSEVSRYYAIFLNAMATIARNFGAKIIKNAGDALIYYFPGTAESTDLKAFQNVIECGSTMIAAHQAINSKLQREKLPPLNYRISVDYGQVQLAKSASSLSDDLFGSTVNMCAKINARAKPNGMVIGENLYQHLKSSSLSSSAYDESFQFERVGEYSADAKVSYGIYSVEDKGKRNILNPFRRLPESANNNL